MSYSYVFSALTSFLDSEIWALVSETLNLKPSFICKSEKFYVSNFYVKLISSPEILQIIVISLNFFYYGTT